MPTRANFAYPNIFGTLSGQVSASLIDQDFNQPGSIILDSAAGWTNAALDTGAANAYIVTLTPPASEYQNGFFLSFIPLNTNTGPSSINVNSLGSIPIVGPDGSQLGTQTLIAGTLYTLMCINSSFRVISPNINVLVGQIVMTGSNNFPNNWLACNGNNVSRSQYSALYAAIGTNYGSGDGSTTFTLPNFTGRFPTYGSAGLTGGASSQTISITTNNLPAHVHPILDQAHSHSYNVVTFNVSGDQLQPLSGGVLIGIAGASTSASLTGINTTQATGGSAPMTFSTVPQYLTTNFIIRAF